MLFIILAKRDGIDAQGGCAITAFLSKMALEGEISNQSLLFYTYIALNYIYRD